MGIKEVEGEERKERKEGERVGRSEREREREREREKYGHERYVQQEELIRNKPTNNRGRRVQRKMN